MRVLLKDAQTEAAAAQSDAERIPALLSELQDAESQVTKLRGRVAQLHERGHTGAYLYGDDEKILGGLNSFYLLEDKPEVYGLPADPKMPSRNLFPASMFSGLGALMVGLVGLLSFRQRRMDAVAGRDNV